MNAIDPASDDDGTVFRDVIMLALLGFVTIVILLLPHINPPTKDKITALPPGNIVVEERWPDKINADVDLWVQAPGDRPVGYSNRGGQVFNLLRDDLGHSGDLAKLNYEVAYSRGAPSGEYTVNQHLFRNISEILPIRVEVVVSLRRKSYGPSTLIAKRTISLRRVGEESTAVRFRLNQSGRLVPGSIHNLRRPLRTTWGSAPRNQ